MDTLQKKDKIKRQVEYKISEMKQKKRNYNNIYKMVIMHGFHLNHYQMKPEIINNNNK